MKELKMKQVRQNDALADVQQADWSNRFKVSAIAAAMTSLICAGVPSYAADIEIYIPGQQNTSTGTVVMMLDTSGSMDVTATKDNNPCDLPSSVTAGTRVTGELTPEGYTVNYCPVVGQKTYHYRKLTESIKTSDRGCGFLSLYACYTDKVTWYSCGSGGLPPLIVIQQDQLH